MGQRITAVAWLERHYGDLFAEGRGIVRPTGTDMVGLKVTSYVPDPVQDTPGPLFSIKRDHWDDQHAWPQAASWPEPEQEDDLDLEGEW